MILDNIIATIPEEVGISWFDFYSIGHVCFGLGIFLFLSLFYVIPKHRGHTEWIALWFILILAIGVLVLWEVLEHTLFMNMGIKFEGRADSIPNLTTDLLLGTIGAVINCIFAKIIVKRNRMWAYYIPGLIAFALWLGVFFIARFLTL